MLAELISNVTGLITGRGPQRPAPTDHDIIAIGDIHGRLDLLKKLTEHIESLPLKPDAELIFLGDYIDRGPDSAGVVDFLLTHPLYQRHKTVFLKGNHEATLLNFLGDPNIAKSWLQYGGGETLLSYGVNLDPALLQTPDGLEELRAAFAQALPESHLRFYKALELFADRGCYFFVHAGIDPERPLHDQGEDSYLWIRDRFLTDSTRFERIIVHGHTPEPNAFKDKRRIGLDTGAYQTGRLSAAYLHGTDVVFLHT